MGTKLLRLAGDFAYDAVVITAGILLYDVVHGWLMR
jgi:hypothetical protein